MSTLTEGAQTLSSKFSSQFITDINASNPNNFQTLLDVIQESPFLVSLFDNLKGDVEIGTSGNGTYTDPSNNNIIFDPSLLPGGDQALSLPLLADVLAHELGHEDLPGGLPNTGDSIDQSIQIGQDAEGAAVTAEYIVAAQLGLSQSYSDDPALDAVLGATLGDDMNTANSN